MERWIKLIAAIVELIAFGCFIVSLITFGISHSAYHGIWAVIFLIITNRLSDISSKP